MEDVRFLAKTTGSVPVVLRRIKMALNFEMALSLGFIFWRGRFALEIAVRFCELFNHLSVDHLFTIKRRNHSEKQGKSHACLSYGER